MSTEVKPKLLNQQWASEQLFKLLAGLSSRGVWDQAQLEIDVVGQGVTSVVDAALEEIDELREQLAEAKQHLDNRKLIERAKGIVMKHLGLDEPEAFAKLQKMSQSKNKKLVDMARIVIDAAEAMSS